MTTSRRGFLAAMLAAATAPAYIKVDRLMTIVVPSKEIILVDNFARVQMIHELLLQRTREDVFKLYRYSAYPMVAGTILTGLDPHLSPIALASHPSRLMLGQQEEIIRI